MLSQYCNTIEEMIKLYSGVTFNGYSVGVVEVILIGRLTGFYFDGCLTGYNVEDSSQAELYDIGDSNRHVIIYSVN